MPKKFKSYDDNYDSEENFSEEEINEVTDNKNYVDMELKLIEILKEIYKNVILQEIESNPSILNNLNKYTEYSFIDFFRRKSKYYKFIENKQNNI